MNNKKEFLNEENYEKTEKKILNLSKLLLVIGIVLAGGIITFGIIKTKSNNSEIDLEIEKVDYVADTTVEIEKLKTELEDKQPRLTEETKKLNDKKSELISKGIKESFDYNDGEAYDLYILNNVLSPRMGYCIFDEYENNDLTKEYCILKNDVENLQDKIKSKEEYISSGRAETDTILKNKYLEQQASSNKSFNNLSFTRYIIPAIAIFMFLGMISLGLFMTAKRRKMLAFTTQQVMPVAQEGIEKMAPTIGKVGAEVAKGISKGIKEGQKEAEDNKE